MAGFDVLRWRARRRLSPPTSPRVSSAAGRDIVRQGRDDESRLWLPAQQNSGGQRALTASAAVVPVGDRRQAMKARYARQGWQCVDPQTEALTRDGWKPYTALRVGDEILTLDLTTGSSVWRPILKLNVYDVVDAEMLSIEGRLHSSLSTLNHRWPVLRRQPTARLYDCDVSDCGRQGFAARLCYGHYNRKRRTGSTDGPPIRGKERRRPQHVLKTVTSADLTPRDRFITAAPYGDAPVDPKWSDAFVELIAWFWTEGHAKRQVSGFYGVIAQSHTVNPTYVARIRAALTAVYGPGRVSLRDLSEPGWREWTDDGMTTFGLNIPAMRILAVAVDMPDKIVRIEFVLSLTRAQLELFVQTSVDADGHRAGETGIVSQSVRDRLGPLEIAAILTGRTPHTYVSQEKWVTHLRNRSHTNPMDCAKRSPGAAGVKRVPYSGVVWCPTVETGTWLARRNGTIYFTHNSEAWAYLDGVGELRYAVQTSANAVSRLRLYPAIQLDPKAAPVPLDEVGANDMPSSVVAAAMEDLALLSDPGHGLSGMQHTQSINKQIVGEYYIVGLPFDPETGGESWSVRSIDEVVVDTDGRFYLRDRPPGFQGYDEPPMPLGPDAFVARCWDSHPRFRALAWSQMRPLLESLEELLLASRMIRSTLRSRLAGAGILLVPDELDLLGVDPTNQDAQSSPFFEELAKAMLTPIQSEGDASEVVPMVVRGPAEILKELRHLTLDRPIDAQAMAIRGELIRRLAIGIDWPPELLLGVGDVSHWAQWFVDESTFRYHYEPQAISSVRQWTQGYAQPMLLAREWDSATAEKAAKVVWWYDPTELLTHPDRTKDAIQLYTMDVLNDDALLRAAGFDPENDKPTASDFLVRLMSKFRTMPPNIVEAIVHRFDPSLEIPADQTEPGMGPRGGTSPIDDGPPSGGGAPNPPGGGNPGRSGPPTDQAAAAIMRLLNGAGREQISLTAAASPPSDGAMLALYPTAEQADALALDGGEPADSLHVTLAYLGKAADLTDEQTAAAQTVAQSIAGLHAPLSGTYSGVARFTGTDDGADPVVATPDVQGLAPLRNMLCEHLAATGVPMPSEHGWTPHTTLSYIAPDDPMPIDRLDPVPADFAALSLVIGGNRTDYPLTGTAEPLVAAASRIAHEGPSRKLAQIDRSLRERIRTAADAALRRQLERANARVISRLNGKPDLRAALQGVPPAQYAATLGEEKLAGAGIDPSALLGDDYTGLRDQVTGWMAQAQAQALNVAGAIVPLTAASTAAVEARQSQHRDDAWTWLAASLGGIAAARLFNPSPEPPPVGEIDSGYLVGASTVRAAVALAGGFGAAEGSQGLGADGLPVDPTERLGGIGTGSLITDTLTDSGAQIEQWTWIYGASLRSFEPHVALEGTTYATHDDPALANDNGWPETDFFYVGDHPGCDCGEEPLWTSSAVPEGSDAASEGKPESGVAASAAVPPFGGSPDPQAAIGRLLARHSSFEFNPDQERDDHGRWIGGGSSEATSSGSRGPDVTDAQKAAAQERLDTVVSPAIKEAIANGQTSDLLYKDPTTGGFTQERIDQQQAVKDRLYAEAVARGVPNDREAVMLGGIPGAGKSTSLTAAGIDASNYLVLNPDDTRTAMLQAGMGIPVAGLSPQETGPLIHEEASQMTKDLAAMAAADGKNVIWDGTMDPRATGDPAAGVLGKLGTLNAAGYTTDMVFVSTDPATASDRALGRYASGIGSELGGRATASSLGIVPQTDGIGNRAVFDSVKGGSNQWWVYDNNGDGAPVQIDHGFGSQSGG